MSFGSFKKDVISHLFAYKSYIKYICICINRTQKGSYALKYNQFQQFI